MGQVSQFIPLWHFLLSIPKGYFQHHSQILYFEVIETIPLEMTPSPTELTKNTSINLNVRTGIELSPFGRKYVHG